MADLKGKKTRIRSPFFNSLSNEDFVVFISDCSLAWLLARIFICFGNCDVTTIKILVYTSGSVRLSISFLNLSKESAGVKSLSLASTLRATSASRLLNCSVTRYQLKEASFKNGYRKYVFTCMPSIL